MKGVNKSHPKQYSTSFDYLSAVIRITRNIRCDNIYIFIDNKTHVTPPLLDVQVSMTTPVGLMARTLTRSVRTSTEKK